MHSVADGMDCQAPNAIFMSSSAPEARDSFLVARQEQSSNSVFPRCIGPPVTMKGISLRALPRTLTL